MHALLQMCNSNNSYNVPIIHILRVFIFLLHISREYVINHKQFPKMLKKSKALLMVVATKIEMSQTMIFV